VARPSFPHDIGAALLDFYQANPTRSPGGRQPIRLEVVDDGTDFVTDDVRGVTTRPLLGLGVVHAIEPPDGKNALSGSVAATPHGDDNDVLDELEESIKELIQEIRELGGWPDVVKALNRARGSGTQPPGVRFGGFEGRSERGLHRPRTRNARKSAWPVIMADDFPNRV
jgi:hypothetical protein